MGERGSKGDEARWALPALYALAKTLSTRLVLFGTAPVCHTCDIIVLGAVPSVLNGSYFAFLAVFN